MFTLIRYEQENGRHPFDEWYAGLRDQLAQGRILHRLRLLREGSMGDCKSVGEGVLELRVHVGAGYRVYCGRSGTNLVILLCGGDKSSQPKDIQRAREFWADWKRRQ